VRAAKPDLDVSPQVLRRLPLRSPDGGLGKRRTLGADGPRTGCYPSYLIAGGGRANGAASRCTNVRGTSPAVEATSSSTTLVVPHGIAFWGAG
jgi:hypothetical protein